MPNLLESGVFRRLYDRVSSLGSQVFEIDYSLFWVLLCLLYWRNYPVAVAVVGSGTHSVVDKGDLLVLSKVTSDSISVGDIIVVTDPHRSLSYYGQRVTQVDSNYPYDVEIQYQPEGSEKLGRRWYSLHDVAGKVALRIPYIATLHVLAYENTTLMLVLLWTVILKPWEFSMKWFRALTVVQAAMIMGSLVLFSLPTPVN